MRATAQLGLQIGYSDTGSSGPISSEGRFRTAVSEVADALRNEYEQDAPRLEDILGAPVEDLQEMALERSLAAGVGAAEGAVTAQISYEPYSFAVQSGGLEITDEIERVRRLVDEIARMSQLPPNFDGEGSSVISRSNIDAACTLILNLHSAYGLVCHDASPTHDGGVEIESKSRYWEMALVVDDPQRIEYLIKSSRGRVSGTASLATLPEILWEQIG